MATELGPIVAKITATQTGLAQEVGKATEAIKNFEKESTKSLDNVYKSVQTNLKQIGKDMKGFNRTLGIVQNQGIGGVVGGVFGHALGGGLGGAIGAQIGHGLDEQFELTKGFTDNIKSNLVFAADYFTDGAFSANKKFEEIQKHSDEIAKKFRELESAGKIRTAFLEGGDAAGKLAERKALGLTPQQIKVLEKQDQREDAAVEKNKAKDIGDKLTKEANTPVETFIDKLKEIQKNLNNPENGVLFKGGRLGISPDVAERLINQQEQKFRGKVSVDLPPQLLADSAEAAQFLAEQRARVANIDDKEEKRQEQLQEDANNLLKEIRDNLKKRQEIEI
jgi:hypothetical protein